MRRLANFCSKAPTVKLSLLSFHTLTPKILNYREIRPNCTQIIYDMPWRFYHQPNEQGWQEYGITPTLFAMELYLTPSRWHGNEQYKRKRYKHSFFFFFLALSPTGCTSYKKGLLSQMISFSEQTDFFIQPNHVTYTYTLDS